MPRDEIVGDSPSDRHTERPARATGNEQPATKIDRAYGSLASYVSEHALGVDGPIRERSLVGRHDTSDEQQWRTEIGWPIFDTTPPA